MGDSTPFPGKVGRSRTPEAEPAKCSGPLEIEQPKPRGVWQWLNTAVAERSPKPVVESVRVAKPSTAPERRRAIAERGTSGGSRQLPYLERIQASFGRHSVSGVRAHIGSNAEAAARELGGRAYAFGDRIAFGAEPDLRTAAHEAAHVIQQRAGVSLDGDIDGGAGDPYEDHANAVAAAVVRGVSAEALLDQLVRRGGGGSSAIQRDSGPPTPAPVPAVPPLPAARRATWEQVDAAATGHDGKVALDIDWLDGGDVPESVRYTIDREFSDYDAGNNRARAAKTDAGVKKVETDFATAKDALRKQVTDRLKANAMPAKAKDVDVDPDYKVQLKLLGDQHDKDSAAAIKAVGDKQDAAMTLGRRDESVTSIPKDKKTITRDQGKALHRTNFMSWAMDVIGDADKVKAHFRGITLVEGTSNPRRSALASNNGMFLAKDAAARFLAARKDFEAAHPGYTFPDTDTAFELRNFHQGRKGLGMLGHALGEAFDFKAGLNPNVAADLDNSYPIGSLGAHDGHSGHSKVNLSAQGGSYKVDDKFQQLGKDTLAAPDAAHANDALATLVYDQFQELVKSSEAMQARMAPQMPLLRDARDEYFHLTDLQATRDKLKDNKSAKRIDGYVAAQLGKFKGTADEKTAKIAEIKADLEAKIAENATAIAASQKVVDAKLKAAFKPWNDEMQAGVDKDTAAIKVDDDALAAMPAELQIAEGTDDAAAMAQLDTYAKAHDLPGLDAMKKSGNYRMPKTPKAYQAWITEQRTSKLNDNKDWHANSSKELNSWIERAKNGRAVFGVEGATVDGHRTTRIQAEQPSLMQLFENGFASNDAMPDLPNAPTGRGQLKQVFNPEVAKTLARYGWSPGSTYGDTMHFDFIEGYNATAMGGRTQHNVGGRTYGPKEPGKPAAAAPAAPAAAAKPAVPKPVAR